MRESQVHQAFSMWLNKHEIPHVHSRTDRKTSTAVGDPDYFVFWCSRVVAIEIKVGKGRLSLAQAKRIAYIRRSGNKVEICRSVEECIEAVKNILCEGKLGDEATPINQRPSFKEEFAAMKSEVAKVPANGKHSVTRPIEQFRIGNWQGQDYVFSLNLDGSYRMTRKASAADIINFKRLEGAAS